MKLKKLLALILALVTVVSCMSVTAFAEETVTPTKLAVTPSEAAGELLFYPAYTTLPDGITLYQHNNDGSYTAITGTGGASPTMEDVNNATASNWTQNDKACYYTSSNSKEALKCFGVVSGTWNDVFVKDNSNNVTGLQDTFKAKYCANGVTTVYFDANGNKLSDGYMDYCPDIYGEIDTTKVPTVNGVRYGDFETYDFPGFSSMPLMLAALYVDLSEAYPVAYTGIHNEDYYTTDPNYENTYRVLLTCDFGATIQAAATDIYLDLESSTSDIYDSKDITQNYTLTQSGDTTYTDVTKVKLAWTVTDISASYTSNKTWNPSTMKWDEDKTVTANDHTATFKLTNYSSVKVAAGVTFTAENALKDTLTSATFANGTTDVTGKTVTLDTPVTKDKTTYTDSDFTAKAQTITATLKFDKDEFAKLSEQKTAATYGKYTVKLSAAPTPITFTPVTALGTNLSVTESSITMEDGQTWAQVIEANKDNSITFNYFGQEYTGELKAGSGESANYAVINVDGVGDILYLSSIDQTTSSGIANDNRVPVTGGAAATVYLAAMPE